MPFLHEIRFKPAGQRAVSLCHSMMSPRVIFSVKLLINDIGFLHFAYLSIQIRSMAHLSIRKMSNTGPLWLSCCHEYIVYFRN